MIILMLRIGGQRRVKKIRAGNEISRYLALG